MSKQSRARARAAKASAMPKIITTVDEMLTDLINIKR